MSDATVRGVAEHQNDILEGIATLISGPVMHVEMGKTSLVVLLCSGLFSPSRSRFARLWPTPVAKVQSWSTRSAKAQETIGYNARCEVYEDLHTGAVIDLLESEANQEFV